MSFLYYVLVECDSRLAAVLRAFASAGVCCSSAAPASPSPLRLHGATPDSSPPLLAAFLGALGTRGVRSASGRASRTPLSSATKSAVCAHPAKGPNASPSTDDTVASAALEGGLPARWAQPG